MADFCEHCEGQRFDRAQVLRTLRRVRSELRLRRCGKKVDEAMMAALDAVATLALPHLTLENPGNDVVH